MLIREVCHGIREVEMAAWALDDSHLRVPWKQGRDLAVHFAKSKHHEIPLAAYPTRLALEAT